MIRLDNVNQVSTSSSGNTLSLPSAGEIANICRRIQFSPELQNDETLRPYIKVRFYSRVNSL